MWLLAIILLFQFNPAFASTPVDLELLLNSVRELKPAKEVANRKTHIYSDAKSKSPFWKENDENGDFWQESSED